MLIIPCPHCGLRDATEFRYGGEAGVNRPANPEQCTDEQWADYLYFRDNKKGVHRERWLHVHGCRQWFVLKRDTATHEIIAVGADFSGLESSGSGGSA